MNAREKTSRGDRLDVLVTLVEAYERKQLPIDSPDPITAIRLVMEQRGLTVKDLEPMLGRANRVYEVLNRKRPLTVENDLESPEAPGDPGRVTDPSTRGDQSRVDLRIGNPASQAYLTRRSGRTHFRDREIGANTSLRVHEGKG